MLKGALKRRIIALFLLCQVTFALSHRLINDDTLDVGNRWEYQLHITEDPDYGSVDWWGTGSQEITGTENVEGYDTSITCFTVSMQVLDDTWWQENYFLDSQNLVEVRFEDDEIRMTVRDGDPFEDTPVWVDESDNAGHFGHGLYEGLLKEYSYTWNGYKESYITYLGMEPISVPAGTFDCIVVLIRQEYYYFDGAWEYWDNKHWYNPVIGSVKSQEEGGFWDPYESSWSYGAGTSELTWTNLPHIGDLNADDNVDMEDFAAFAGHWRQTQDDQNWNKCCDLYQDGKIDELDLSLFCDNWLADIPD